MWPFSRKGKIEKTVQETTNADSERWETQQNYDAAKIAAEIKILSDAQNTQTAHEDGNAKINTALSVVTIFLVFLTVIFTGLSWCAFREQLVEMKKVYAPIERQAKAAQNSADAARKAADASEKSNIYANRAWVGVSHIDFLRTPDDADGPLIEVHYQNVGKHPALDLKSGGTWLILSATSETTEAMPKSSAWAEFDSQIREQCLKVEPLLGGSSVFPVTNVEGFYRLSAPIPLPNMRLVTLSRTHILVAPGCLTYNTFEKPRHTAFCYYAEKRDGKWNFKFCPVGNFAT
jgi:hypothetical protein